MATLRIGVTGHRRYHEAAGVRRAVEAVLARLLAGAATPTVISSLAEGADRLLATMALEAAGGRLEVVLPLEPDELRADFRTAASMAEFDHLLASATDVVVIAGELVSREDAYELAGRAVVERCDVLVALWDGEPARGVGGTAIIIQYALEHGVPVEVVLVERDAPADVPAG